MERSIQFTAAATQQEQIAAIMHNTMGLPRTATLTWMEQFPWKKMEMKNVHGDCFWGL
jgi:hypothetical protein